MNIIITRPVEDSELLAEKLRVLGHSVSVLPMITIVPRVDVKIPTKSYQAICLTSANGVRSIGVTAALKACPVIAVGPHSLQAAIDAGFTNVSAQGGDVEGLATYVKQKYDPQSGPMLYISGSETSGDLEGKLTAAGFSVDRVVTYDAVPSSLSGHEAPIKQGDAVMLYSPRSAKIWQAEILRLKLQALAEKMVHYCLSANVAASLPQSWPIVIAKTPTEASILAALEQNSKAE